MLKSNEHSYLRPLNLWKRIIGPQDWSKVIKSFPLEPDCEYFIAVSFES